MSEAKNAGPKIEIEEWRPDGPGAGSLEQDIEMLVEVLHAVVHAGAGVSFIVPFSLDDARAFWTDKVLPGVRARSRRVVVARSGGRTLLTLDTVTGGNAEPPYRSLGYITVGVIPRYARGSLTPDLEDTTIMYKELAPAPRAVGDPLKVV